MAVQRNKTESNGETACDETEKSEGLSGMPKIEAIESIISKPSPTSWGHKKGHGGRKKTNLKQNYFYSNLECEYYRIGWVQ